MNNVWRSLGFCGERIQINYLREKLGWPYERKWLFQDIFYFNQSLMLEVSKFNGFLINHFVSLFFIKKTLHPSLSLLTLWHMTKEFKNVLWISVGHSLETTDHDHDKSYIISSHVNDHKRKVTPNSQYNWGETFIFIYGIVTCALPITMSNFQKESLVFLNWFKNIYIYFVYCQRSTKFKT